MKKLLTVLIAVLFVAGFTAGTAYAAGPDFESNMIEVGSSEVAGESKLYSDGAWKVEIEDDGTAGTDYQICIDVAGSGGTTFLINASSDEDGELKVKVSAGAPADVDPGTYQGISFRVFDGTDDTCTGTLEYESGATITD